MCKAIILPIVLSEREVLSLILREEHRLKGFEKIELDDEKMRRMRRWC
jgi:hypothetical protein